MKVDVTPELVEKIQTAIADTGTPLATLLRGRKDKPPGYNTSKIFGAIAGRVQTIDQRYVLYTLKICDEAQIRIPDTADFIKKVRAEEARTGLTYGKVLRHHPVKGLTYQTLTSILTRRTKTMDRAQAEAFLAEYAALPDAREPILECTIARGHQATKTYSLTIPADVADALLSRIDQEGFVDRAEYMRHLVRQDHKKPITQKKLKATAGEFGLDGKNKTFNVGFPATLWAWIGERTAKLPMDQTSYLFSLALLALKNQ